MGNFAFPQKGKILDRLNLAINCIKKENAE